MGKNQSASNLPNIIQYSNGSINFVSGSTLLMQISSSGAITTTGVISGSNALSSSYAVNSDQLDGFDSTAFVFTSSFNTYSSSMSTRVTNNESTGSTLTTASASFAVVSSSYSTASGSLSTRVTTLEAASASLNTASGSFSTRTTTLENASSSLNTASGSFSTRVTKIEGNYATTGSNVFIGTQVITGSVLVTSSLSVTGCIVSTGQIVAQTINVQQVTSSVVYSCGSNVFGCNITDTQRMTGSVLVTGSLNVTGNTCVTSICSPAYVGGTFSGTTISGTTNYASTVVCSPVVCAGTSCASTFSGGTFSGTTISGTTINASTAVCGPTICGGTVCGTVGCFASVCSPAHIGGTFSGTTISGTTLYGSTAACAPTILGTTVICGPTICGGTVCGTVGCFVSTCSPTYTGGTFSGTTVSGTTLYGSTAVCSPTILGTTVVSGSVGCFVSICSPTHIGGTFSGTTNYASTVACSPVGCFTTSCASTFSGGTFSGTTISGTTIYGSTNLCGPSVCTTDGFHCSLRMACRLIPFSNYRTSDCGYGGIDFFNNGKGYACSAKFYTFKSDTGAEFYGLTNDYNGSAQLALISCGGNGGENISFFTGTSTTAKLRIDNNVSTFSQTLCGLGDAYFKGAGNYNTVNVDNTSTTGGGGVYLRQNGTIAGGIGVSGWYDGNTTCDILVVSETGKNIRFYTNAANERLRIASTGEACFRCQVCSPLLIGNNSSQQIMAIGAEADIWMCSTGGGAGVWRLLGSTGTATKLFRIYDGDAGSNRLTINTSGVVCTPFGIRYGNGSTTLNYYEEGSWTPVLRGSSVAGTVGYANRSASYVRIGNYVYVRWGFQLNSIAGASGTVVITGLPFTGVSWGAYQEPSVSVGTGNLACAQYAGIARMFVEGGGSSLAGRVMINTDTAWDINQFSGDEWIIGEIFYNV